MNDPPNRAAPTDKAADTHSRAIESTGARSADPERTAAAAGGPANTGRLPPFGDYHVVRKIGEGGMGSVYLAEDTKLGRLAAVKTMRPELAADPKNRNRFVREAQAAAAVEHDNIVPIWHIGAAADGTPFIAMPFLKGEMLDARLKREPVSPPDLILKVAGEVAEGLAAAHAVGLIHRDIKPANVWLEGDPTSPDPARRVRRCKVLDFGLARSLESADAHITATGAILGTPAYMAPEQARGERVDHRADLWSLGVMLHRMAAGRPPFRGENAMAVLIALATEVPPPACEVRPDLPFALGQLIDRLMEKDASARPQTAAEVAAVVRAIEDGELSLLSSPVVVAAPVASPWEAATAGDEGTAADDEPDELPPDEDDEAEPARGRRPWLIGAACAGVLALVALAVGVGLGPAEGTLVVEVAADAEAKFAGGRLVLFGPDGQERYRLAAAERDRKLPAGPYTVRVDGAEGVRPSAGELTVRRGERVTVRVALAPKPSPLTAPKPPPPKPTVDFREIHAVGEAELEQWMEKQQTDGYLPSFLSSEAGPDVRFSAVAVPNAAKVSWRFVPRQDVLGPRWQSDWQARMDSGLRPDLYAVYHSGGRQYEAQMWVTATRAGGSWSGARAFILGKLDGLRAPNSAYRPVNLAATPGANGQLYYQFVMGARNGRDWDAQFDLTAEGLADAVAQQKKLGWRLDWLSAYRDGAQLRFMALFGEDPDRNAPWDFQMGLSAKEYEDRVAARTSRPLIVVGYVAAGAGPAQYAVVWSKEPPPRAGAANPAADREAAAWAIGVGGGVRIDGGEAEVRNTADLPKGAFRLTGVNVRNIKVVTDDGLAVFAPCRDLTFLSLWDTLVTDDGLRHFAGCRDLAHVELAGTPIRGPGLLHLKDAADMRHVHLAFADITSASLEVCRGWPNLAFLDVGGTAVGDAGLEHLKGCERLSTLHLGGTRVTDAGLERIKGFTRLTGIQLHATSVTPAATAALARSLPRCRISAPDRVYLPTK